MANEDKATRYHRLHRRAAFASTALGAIYLLVLLSSGASAALRDGVAGADAVQGYVALVLYVVVAAAGHDLLQLPLAFYQGVTLERRYGLSNQSTARWALDHLKAWSIGLVLLVAAAVIAWTLLRADPARWWLWAAAAFVALLVLFAHLAPVVLLPLFYRFVPLDRPELSDRLLALARRAGTPVIGVFEWKLSDRTRKANAALAGMGTTRRILLSDTLLAAHTDDEIEVILAHELAHHVHRDIWSGIAIETVLIGIGFYLADRVLTAFGHTAGLTGKTDIAALPLLVLAVAGVSLLLMPFANAFSRAHERRADRYALTMTRNADAFISAMRRLASQNLAEERPSRLVETLFHSHPSTSARVEAAEAWKRWTGNCSSPSGRRR